MALRVHIVCQNPRDDRIIPRMARALHEQNGWTLCAQADPAADVNYLSAYFESQRLRPWPDTRVAAYFTHREEEPPGNAKARLYDKVAQRVDLRIATCRLYAAALEAYGPTAQVPAPVEIDRFTLAKTKSRSRPVCGFSGYTYANKRKGEDLALAAISSEVGRRCEWRASGRGWPVRTVRYPWAEMPAFYQGLDVLVCTSRVEGIPMPPLEALACGVSVVVPQGVGMLDELPQVLGIHRYKRGDAESLVKALGKAVETRPRVDREALRAAIKGHSVADWCATHEVAFEEVFGDRVNAGLAAEMPVAAAPVEVRAEDVKKPKPQGTGSTRGIYCVAFGDPARMACLRMMKSAKRHMPEIPICLCSDRKIGPEDVLVIHPDTDVGGRRAKLRAYELSPAEWKSVLYLDADTEVVGDIRFYFQLIEDGWEFVICKDPHLMDTMHAFRRRNNLAELAETERAVHTLHTTQINGGVWAFGRNERIARFFARWQAEWERYAQRDQGALVRALYADPLKIYLLGNQWNTFPKYTKGIKTAGLMHYPGRARRWSGLIPGRIDSEVAWAAVRRYEKRRLRR